MGAPPPRLTHDQMIAELPHLRRRGAVVIVLSDGDIEMTTTDHCFIWPDSLTEGESAGVTYPSVGQQYVRWIVNSPRAGGVYFVNANLLGIHTLRSLDDGAKARLTTLLIDMRNQNDEDYIPEITEDLVKLARRARPLDVDERAERLLMFIGRQSKAIGDTVTLNATMQRSIGDRVTMVTKAPTDVLYMQAMAWSESVSVQETQYLLDYLLKQGVIGSRYRGRYQVTVEGYRRLAEGKTNLDSGQAFVAMWFGGEMNDAYEKGIEPAIVGAGFTPMRIDRKQDVVKIDDEIIAEIRRSRFLVADFTHGEDGARGGVYFEAGFAFGLSIPVIYVCREDAIDKIHFDTRQYHHITWNNPEDLRKDLKNRILALIGEGPG